MSDQGKDYSGPVWGADEDPFATPEKEAGAPRQGHTYDVSQPIPDHLRPPAEMPQPRWRLRDRNTSEAMFRLKAALLVIPAAPGFAIAIAAITHNLPSPIPLIAAIVALPLGWFIAYKFVMYMSDGAGSAGSSLYFGSGKTTPADRQYSLAQSYVARGMYSKAAEEYQKNAAQYPTDAEPCMRVARLYRDELANPEQSIQWFKRAAGIPGVNPGTEMMALRELIEVYTHRLHQDRAAAPYLARLAKTHASAPTGIWAKQELAAMKAAMREESTET